MTMSYLNQSKRVNASWPKHGQRGDWPIWQFALFGGTGAQGTLRKGFAFKQKVSYSNYLGLHWPVVMS